MERAKLWLKIEASGYDVERGTYEYWDSIPYVEHEDGRKTFIAKTVTKFGSTGVDLDVSFEKAMEAIKRKCRDINDLEDRLLEEKIDREFDARMGK